MNCCRSFNFQDESMAGKLYLKSTYSVTLIHENINNILHHRHFGYRENLLFIPDRFLLLAYPWNELYQVYISRGLKGFG